MSGLIWAGIGQGIANAGRTAGDFMMRSELEEDRQREREELQRERLAATERENERARLSREQMAADRLAAAGGRGGGGADGGLPAKSIGEGGEDEAMLARRAGMTVPELRSLRKYSETGDTEPFKRDTNKITMKDTGDPYNPETESQIVKELPPGFEREARAKMQTLAKIEESYRLGGKYDDVTKGRRNQQEVDMSEAALGQPAAAGVIGQAMAAGKGNDLIGGDSNVTRNKFTGATETTEVGRAEVAKDYAQADKTKREPTGKNEDLPTLQQMRKAAEETLKDARKALTEFDKVNQGDLSRPGKEKLKEQRDALALEVNNARTELTKVSDRLARRLDETEASSKSPSAAPKPAPAADKPPAIGQIKGAPAGAAIGQFVAGRGWEIKDRSGKVVGYAGK